MSEPAMSKIEYAAIHIASGVHGTVAPDQLAATSVQIAAAVLAECEAWMTARDAAEMLADAKEPSDLEKQAAERKAHARIEAAGKHASDKKSSADAIKSVSDQRAQAAKEAAAAEKEAAKHAKDEAKHEHKAHK